MEMCNSFGNRINELCLVKISGYLITGKNGKSAFLFNVHNIIGICSWIPVFSGCRSYSYCACSVQRQILSGEFEDYLGKQNLNFIWQASVSCLLSFDSLRTFSKYEEENIFHSFTPTCFSYTVN